MKAKILSIGFLLISLVCPLWVNAGSGSGVTVTMTPSKSQTLSIDTSLQFKATVTGTSNTAVTWSAGNLVGGNVIVGTITTSGLYTAPALMPFPDLITITATSVADPSQSASVGVTVTPRFGVTVTLSPVASWRQTGQTLQFTSNVIGTTNNSVTWSVAGTVGGNSKEGTISSTGLYTAPGSVPTPPQVSVSAASVADPVRTSTGTISIGNTPFFATPLVDFGPGQLYLGRFSGNLYTGSNSPPPVQDSSGLVAAAEVQPLDGNGNPTPSGKIVLISLGMSEASDDWCDGQTACTNFSFMGQAAASDKVNHSTLVILNGAQASQNAETWTCASGNCPPGSLGSNNYDRVLDTVLTPAGLTEAQVQVVWIQEANTEAVHYPHLPRLECRRVRSRVPPGRNCTGAEGALAQCERGYFLEPNIRGIRGHHGEPRTVCLRSWFCREVAHKCADHTAGDRSHRSFRR